MICVIHCDDNCHDAHALRASGSKAGRYNNTPSDVYYIKHILLIHLAKCADIKHNFKYGPTCK